RVEIDPNRVSRVRPRFPGIVKYINAEMGDVVSAGETLLTVESSESLQEYPIKAPISGLITMRNVQAEEVTGGEPLYIIVDLSRVWIQLDIFPKDMGKIKIGQELTIQSLDGHSISGEIERLSPMSNLSSQTIHAIVPIDNADKFFRPGQFVTAEVEIAEHQIPLAVKRSGVQRFRDFDVVYGKFGDIYEVRMLELGLTNEVWMEVIGGLEPGTEYVTENSYLIKADIEKSGASHDH
ncbi:MAG: HlyD family efflux transporter periplasmic adaptor subunit, partial [Gammaproteobacteria bacterium]|nr:HlyD family efflux transporter periplasmic adaptor subunit [Gammaproteobacteria bacterium]